MSDLVIEGKYKTVADVPVIRLIPSIQNRHVGPFVFLDRFGPQIISKDQPMDTDPHPHIGLSTVTYLISGRGFHRDSIGSAQMILPGDLNVMKAGRGIAHSERTPEEDRVTPSPYSLYGLQFWTALPVEEEESEPAFHHYPRKVLPIFSILEGVEAKLLMGQFNGYTSPVHTYTRTLFIEFKSTNQKKFQFSCEEQEAAIFLIEGKVSANGTVLTEKNILILDDKENIEIVAEAGSRFGVIGGDALPEKRYIWWNFVSSKIEQIHLAALSWKTQTFPKITGEEKYTPLPDDSYLLMKR